MAGVYLSVWREQRGHCPDPAQQHSRHPVPVVEGDIPAVVPMRPEAALTALAALVTSPKAATA